MSFQSTGNQTQLSGVYRSDLLVDAFGVDGRSPRELAKDAGVSHTTMYQALEGECKKIDPLDRIVKAMRPRIPKLSMKDLFDPDLTRDQFRRTVLGGSQRARR